MSEKSDSTPDAGETQVEKTVWKIWNLDEENWWFRYDPELQVFVETWDTKESASLNIEHAHRNKEYVPNATSTIEFELIQKGK
jgi:hypothetical protein